jgi:hypothetical protein
MRWIAIFCALFFLPPALFAQNARDGTPQAVRDAIQKGVEFLKRNQGRNGSWEEKFNAAPIALGDYTGGVTALAMLALLESGVDPKEPFMKKGLDYLAALPIRKTYVASLQAIVLCQADPVTYGPKIHDIKKWLLDTAVASSGGTMIAWSYPIGNTLGRADHSNTQYAVLALREIHWSGDTVPEEIWSKIQKMYRESQLANGGWGYYIDRDAGERLTMTSAGVCGLLICDMCMPRIKGPPGPDGEYPNCDERDNTKNLDIGLHRIGSMFQIDLAGRNLFEGSPFPFYNVYGLERVGRFSGLRFFNRDGTLIDWYKAGIKTLLAAQKPSGSWESRSSLIDGDPAVATSFALLFLAKGKTPVLIHKMAHGPTPRKYSGSWNVHYNDIRNLTDFCSKQVFKRNNRPIPLTWQIFDASRQAIGRDVNPDVILQDLLQAPVCFINGLDAPKFSAGEKNLLKRYIEQGGFIFAEASCGKQEFDQGFRFLCKELFPERELTPIPPGHAIWNSAFQVPAGSFDLQGIDLGCKTCLVYSPRGMSSHWESNLEKYPKTKLAFQLGANVIAYATGLEPPEDKGTKKEITKNEESQIQRNFLQVAQVNYGSRNWQPAPNAMRTLMSEAAKHGLDVILQTKPVTPYDADLVNNKFLYMHGRGDFTWDNEQMKRMREHLQTGGLLLCDACCGDKVFDKRFRETVQTMFGRTLEPIAISDPLYSKRISGKEIKTVQGRTEGGKPYQAMEPTLEGIKLDAKDPTSPWIIVYSKYDIGCALDRHASADCLGYNHESALDLALQVLLYALKE